MPPLDLSSLRDLSGMEVDSDSHCTRVNQSHDDIPPDSAAHYAPLDCSRQSGKKMRIIRGHRPFDMWDSNSASAFSANAPATLYPSSAKLGYTPDAPATTHIEYLVDDIM